MPDFSSCKYTHRTLAAVDLAAIRHNGQVARKTFPEQKILFVLKADAYGHGIAGILPAAETFADYYAVATVEEALTVRRGSDKPVLLFGPVPEERMAEAAAARITFTVGSVRYAELLSARLAEAGLTADCHLKIDTGLHRSGVIWNGSDSVADLLAIHGHKNLRFTGTYTHFACGEGTEPWEAEFTKGQFDAFTEALSAMEANGLPTGLRHCCSTGGSLVHPEYRLDMVRLGMMPLGMSYSDESVKELGLRPALTWVSFITDIKQIGPEDAVSYGCTFRASAPMRIAMVSCGYADGYRRVYSNKTEVLIGGRRVPVIGRVAMDYLMLDVTGIPDAAAGTPVVLLGQDGGDCISAQQLSCHGESVSGEVTCAISPRVPRIFTDSTRQG